VLTRFAPAYLAAAFLVSRPDGAHRHTFGPLPSDLIEASAGAKVERVFPA